MYARALSVVIRGKATVLVARILVVDDEPAQRFALRRILERAGHEAVTSTITMTELLVPSYRDNNEHRVDEFYGLLST